MNFKNLKTVGQNTRIDFESLGHSKIYNTFTFSFQFVKVATFIHEY